jgi:glycosyltransferase involved in cell wall biosynthesis
VLNTLEIASRSPLISVIMPAFNHDRYMGEALDSVGAQALEDIELIVVDDGSDRLIEGLVLAKVPAATIIRQTNAGPSAARNAGIARARGRFIAFLDADDVWVATALQRLFKGFKDAPAVQIVQGNHRQFFVPGDVASLKDARIGPARLAFNLGAVLVRREVFLKYGMLDEDLRRGEDVDLFLRWAESGVARLIIPDTVLYYRKYKTSRHHVPIVDPREQTTQMECSWSELLHRSLARRRTSALAVGQGATCTTVAQPLAAAVAVIVTVCNGMPYLPDAIAAIRRQTLPPHEIVAVVGRSDDGTLEYLRSQPEIGVIEQSGFGPAAGRNAGLQATKCPLVAFCDHDNLWHPDKLEKQVAVLSQFSAPAACIVNFEEYSEEEFAEQNADLFWNVPTLAWTPSALLAHRDVFASVGQFDPALGLGCDTDWFRRLRQLDIPCGVAGRILLRKRRHAANLSRDPHADRAAMFKMPGKMRSELKHASERRPPSPGKPSDHGSQ